MCLTNIKKPKVAEEEIITYKVLCISNGMVETPFYQQHVDLQQEYSKPFWCDDIEAATEDEIDGLVFHVFANEKDAKEMALRFNLLSGEMTRLSGAGDSYYHRRYFIVKTIIPRGATYVEGIFPMKYPDEDQTVTYQSIGTTKIKYTLEVKPCMK